MFLFVEQFIIQIKFNFVL